MPQVKYVAVQPTAIRHFKATMETLEREINPVLMLVRQKNPDSRIDISYQHTPVYNSSQQEIYIYSLFCTNYNKTRN